MFNALGIYSNPLPSGPHPTRGVGPLLPVIVAVGTGNGIGGYGNDIFNNGTISSGTGYTGSQGIPGPPGTIGLVPVTLVTTTPFSPTLADYLIDVNVAGPSSIVLPVGPTGTVFIVKDISGAAATNPITVTATGGALIDGAASALINTNYGSLTFIFNGTEWNIV